MASFFSKIPLSSPLYSRAIFLYSISPANPSRNFLPVDIWIDWFASALSPFETSEFYTILSKSRGKNPIIEGKLSQERISWWVFKYDHLYHYHSRPSTGRNTIIFMTIIINVRVSNINQQEGETIGNGSMMMLKLPHTHTRSVCRIPASTQD